MVRKALLKLHLPKKGKQKCCCCKSVVDKDDLELWLLPEVFLRDNEEGVGEWIKTGSQVLHPLCSNCVDEMDGDLCKPVNRVLGFDDNEGPPPGRRDQVV